MKIYNEADEKITQDDVDYNLGYLKTDYRFVKTHEAIPPQDEEGHTQVTVTFTDGDKAVFDNYPTKYFDEECNFIATDEYEGKEVEDVSEDWVIDKPYNPGEPEWNENEEILRYVLYTEEELEQKEAAAAADAQAAQEEADRNQKVAEMYAALDAVKAAFPDYAPKSEEE